MTTTDTQILSAITERAAEWFAAHRADALPEQARVEFFAWLKASPVHIEEYLGIAALERNLTEATAEPALSLAALREISREEADDNVAPLALVRKKPPRSTAAAPSVRRPGFGAAIAATCAVAATLAAAALGLAWYDGHSPWLGPARTYQTVRGEQRSWPLPDGSMLYLDTDSAVTMRLSSKLRALTLDRGRALFQVTHDAARPFHVAAADTDTAAVGTMFDVYRSSAATQITVEQGRVIVSLTDAQTDNPTGSAPVRGLRVDAGQRVRVTSAGLPAVPQDVSLQDAVAWRQHEIVFEARPLAEVAEEFNRYNRVPITIQDPALRELRISGRFDAYDLESFTAFLRSLDGVQVTRRADGIFVARIR